VGTRCEDKQVRRAAGRECQLGYSSDIADLVVVGACTSIWIWRGVVAVAPAAKPHRRAGSPAARMYYVE
jgi:hypothetical protein